MARFEVPEGWVVQAYRFALDPSPVQARVLESHCGAARFAFNHMLNVVKKNLDQRGAERSYGIAEEDLTPLQGWSLAQLRKSKAPRVRSFQKGAAGFVRRFWKNKAICMPPRGRD